MLNGSQFTIKVVAKPFDSLQVCLYFQSSNLYSRLHLQHKKEQTTNRRLDSDTQKLCHPFLVNYRTRMFIQSSDFLDDSIKPLMTNTFFPLPTTGSVFLAIYNAMHILNMAICCYVSCGCCTSIWHCVYYQGCPGTLRRSLITSDHKTCHNSRLFFSVM